MNCILKQTNDRMIAMNYIVMDLEWNMGSRKEELKMIEILREFHKKYDIAVVPTIFSEGTSLSLIEAMSAGCLPIASHVGGMTNIILDSFNGFLTYPSEEELYKIIVKVLNLEKAEFNSIVKNAYHSACSSFSISKWKSSWREILMNI